MYCLPHHPPHISIQTVVACDHYYLFLVAVCQVSQLVLTQANSTLMTGLFFPTGVYMTDQWVIINTSMLLAVGVSYLIGALYITNNQFRVSIQDSLLSSSFLHWPTLSGVLVQYG